MKNNIEGDIVLYDEVLIKAVGEKRIEQALLNNEKLNLKSHNEEEVKLIYALENYIVKYNNKAKTTQLEVKIKDKKANLLDLFQQNPSIIDYSYILSNLNVLKFLYPKKDDIEKFNLGYNKLTRNWEQNYNKLINNESVSSIDIDNLMAYFSRMINFNNNKTKSQEYVFQKIQKYIKKLLTMNRIPTRDSECLFLFNYCSKYVFYQNGYHNEFRNIRLINILSHNNKFIGGYELNCFIGMNDHTSQNPLFYHNLEHLIQAVMHETTHAIQELQAKNDPNSVHAMEMVIQKEFGKDQYTTGRNYLFNEIEEDAQKKAYYYASLLYRPFNKDVADNLKLEKKLYLKKIKFEYEYVTVNENGKELIMSKEKFNVINIRKIIKKNPLILLKYPVLKNIFYSNGQSKNIDEMLSEDFELHDINKMYKDFILYDLRNNGLNSIVLKNKTTKQKENILKKLISLLYDEVGYVIEILNDYTYRKNNAKKSSFFYLSHINNIIIISSFVEKELAWMRKWENNNPGHYELYSLYIHNIKILMNSIDKSYSNKTITNLEESTKNIINPLISLDCNIKEDYIISLLEKYTDEELKTPITFDGKNYNTLELFIKLYIKKHIDRNHYIYDDNGQVILDNNSNAILPRKFIENILNKKKQL